MDERAEVELISRDIVLTSDAGLAGTDGFGGDIKIRPGFTQVLFQGVQLENLSPNAATALVEAEKPNVQSRAPTEPPPAAPVVPLPAVPIVPPPAAPPCRPSPLESCSPGTLMPVPTEFPKKPDRYYACLAPDCETAIVRADDSHSVSKPRSVNF